MKPTEMPELQGRMIKWQFYQNTQISNSLDFSKVFKVFKTKNFKTI